MQEAPSFGNTKPSNLWLDQKAAGKGGRTIFLKIKIVFPRSLITPFAVENKAGLLTSLTFRSRNGRGITRTRKSTDCPGAISSVTYFPLPTRAVIFFRPPVSVIYLYRAFRLFRFPFKRNASDALPSFSARKKNLPDLSFRSRTLCPLPLEL